jgi:hypothetical protein
MEYCPGCEAVDRPGRTYNVRRMNILLNQCMVITMQTRDEQIKIENTALRKFQLAADEICHQIRLNKTTKDEIDRQISDLRASAVRMFPNKMDLFDLIYMRRFERLWREWRVPDQS